MPEIEAKADAGKGLSKARRSGRAMFAFVARSLQQISTFVITLLAARFLLPAEYGVYSLGIVFITLIQTLTYTGFYHFIVTSKDDDETVLSTSFWMITGLATIAAALLAIAALPISWAFDSPELFPVLLLLAAAQPVAGAGAWFSAALLRRQAVDLHFAIMFAQNFIALVGGAALLWLWQSLFALVAFRYLRVLSGAALYLTFSKDRPGFLFDKALARRATGFSGGLYGSRFLNFLSRYAGDLLLGLMFTTAEAGLYRFGSRVAGGAIDIVSQPMRSFALTQFGIAGRTGADLANPLERFVGSVMLLTGIVAAVTIVFAPAVVDVFFNPAYSAALAVTYAMAVRSVLNIGTLVLEPALAAQSQTGKLFSFNLFWTVITIASALAASPFGLSVLAWSQAAVMLLNTLSALYILKRSGISVGRTTRALIVAAALSAGFGLVLYEIWSPIRTALGEGAQSISIGLAVASLLALALLAIGSKLKVFTLNVFSG
ncbi:oligosaccharide flippase family protein [Alloyangia pacifica]|uniref:Membrane protein involved in the export of O-antigen and teichoic acid n=1 Tax=Alloyangia pacifica TaxID=311180 RepID=A0A1I6T3Y6_9RHOB|nr:oligosaccharide flippase family protein [Alloyangia pacifica]SDG96971.1 Membrane protein involved in the export of O-antigen and teichoic acid [Alloyangia pacifica]SFS83955.1 Membrane protein involved in the export of O-antigen and teichoic acid [Alloyangia pacifica]